MTKTAPYIPVARSRKERAATRNNPNSCQTRNHNQNQNRRTRNRSHSRRHSRTASMRFCEICTETKPSNLTFSVPNCSHGFCNECIGKHVQAKVKTNAHAIVCPAVNCKQPIEYESCGSIVPRSAMEKWGELLCEASIVAAQKLYFREVDEVVEAAECGACHRLFCARCKTAWHSDVGCEEFQGLGENDRAREDLMLKSLAREKKWGRCPCCKYIVEKIGGCHHMVCRCNFQFCYLCGAEWTNDHGVVLLDNKYNSRRMVQLNPT